ncbi:TetR/AcrR family transcriptional regulator [Brachybacterium sp.]|uniref:TetR/AcrR family transcriptional regulator n=1 Tax=Brachybacterium sp. TaxID=1891286 RepID=UPI002ED26FB6
MALQSPRPAHRPSAREAMLEAAEAHLGADGTLSLDSAARAAGVTKPGLMYHFSTKEELLIAVLERLTSRYEREMAESVARLVAAEAGASLDGPAVGVATGLAAAAPGLVDATAPDLADATASQRALAYLDWACRAPLSPADLVIFADPKLRVALTERWREQVDRWLAVPAGESVDRRRRLLGVRLMADGLWFDRASGLLETTTEDAQSLRALALDLLEEEDS